MNINLFTHKEISSIKRPLDEYGCMAIDYVSGLGANTSEYISNINTDFRLLQVNDSFLPVSINDRELENSYVCSPYTHYISYAYDELHFIPNKILRSVISTCLIKPFDYYFKKTTLNKVIIVNNWLLSTNLYPNLSSEEILGITQYLTKKFPKHVIMFRSIQQKEHSGLIAAFTHIGYMPIPSRQVYIWDPKDLASMSKKQRKNLSRDDSLLDNPDLQIKKVDLGSPKIDTLVDAYNKLYLRKYSYCNPQLSSSFFSLCISKNILEIFSLTDHINKTSGVVGLLRNKSTITAPILGYETEHAQGHILYRAASALSYREARKENLICHKSSGAPEFKRFRGCKSEIEYSYVYTKHVSKKSAAPWILLGRFLNTVAVPLMKKYKL